MMKHDTKIQYLFKKIFIKYGITISLNKNLLLSSTFGFIISLLVAYIFAIFSTSNFANLL